MKFSSFKIILIFICLALVGLALLPQLPIKLSPTQNLPQVNVSFGMYGASPLVVETEATSKLEAMLGRMKGVRKITSTSWNGGGRVTIELDKHVDPDGARFEVSTIIRQAWPQPPIPQLYVVGTGETDRYTAVCRRDCQTQTSFPERHPTSGCERSQCHGMGV